MKEREGEGEREGGREGEEVRKVRADIVLDGWLKGINYIFSVG
jgi:hypothetical protein